MGNIKEISRDVFPRLPPCVLLHGPASRGRLQLQLHKVGQLEGCFSADQLWLPMLLPHILRLCWSCPGQLSHRDGSGARWCYVDAALGSSCQDLTPSARFPNNPWSYEACATPAIDTLECPALVAAVPATVAVPVPAPHHPTVVQPAHPEVFNPYPEPPLDCRVPIAGCPDFVPNPAPTDAFVPTNVFPDNVRGDNSNNVDDNIFPDNVRSQDLNSSEVNFGEPTK